MKRGMLSAGVLLLTACGAFAQTSDSTNPATPPPPPPPPPSSHVQLISPYDVPAFSRMSIGAGLSPLGIGLQVSTDVNAHLNLRAIGNIFTYSTSITSNGIPINANLTLGTGGVMADYYPFHVGFRLSGGLLFVNQNGASAKTNIPGGSSFTLDQQTYYSSDANPLAGTGSLALNTAKPGGIVTIGWGNHVKRGGHWTVPFELGVVFAGSPKVKMALSGTACIDPAQTECSDVTGNNPIAQQFQSNLSSQIEKWNSDLNPLSTYPVISVGIAYSFQTKAY